MKRLGTLLPADESVTVAVLAQVKGGEKKRLGKDLATGVAATLAVSAVTGGAAGVMVVTVPPAVWVVVTPERVLMIEKRTGAGFRTLLGDVVFSAPRKAITATLKAGLMNQVIIADRSDGQSLLTVGTGARKKAAESIATAISG